MKPITPKEAKSSNQSSIPDVIFEAFNTLLSEGYHQHGVTVMQDKLLDLVRKLNPDLKIQAAFDCGWFDVEPMYEKAGWSVKYDKPSYNETYAPSWHFTPKKRAAR